MTDLPPLPIGRSQLSQAEFAAWCEVVIRDLQLQRLTLSRPRQKAGDGPSRVTVRPVLLKGETCFQWTSQVGPQQLHENLAPQELCARLREPVATQFLDVSVRTTTAEVQALRTKDERLRVTHRTAEPVASAPAEHNRTKSYLIPESTPCEFLHALGVMTADGKVRADGRKKFRQINRYLEFVNDILPALPAGGPLRVIDFGCGKSSLTFALHYLLTVHHQRDVQILGLDLKADVIRKCQQLAERLQLQGLRFELGDIAGHQADGPVHLAVSLHACDTATDDALAQAVRWQANVILAVPCCQHEVFQKMQADFLPVVTQHGLFKERTAAIVTDALRVQLLEIAGYQTQLLEFIDMEHTPKNVLIRAVRRTQPVDVTSHKQQFVAFRQSLGIDRLHLEEALGERIELPANS